MAVTELGRNADLKEEYFRNVRLFFFTDEISFIPQGRLEWFAEDGAEYMVQYIRASIRTSLVYQLFPVFKECRDAVAGLCPFPEGYYHYDLQHGAHLVVAESLRPDFEAAVGPVSRPGQIFARWRKAGEALAEKQKAETAPLTGQTEEDKTSASAFLAGAGQAVCAEASVGAGKAIRGEGSAEAVQAVCGKAKDAADQAFCGKAKSPEDPAETEKKAEAPEDPAETQMKAEDKKKALRKKYFRLVRDLSYEYRDRAGRAIADLVETSREFRSAKTIFIYISTGFEPETRELIRAAWRAGKTVLVPKCTGPHEMAAVKLTGWEELKPAGFQGIPEPESLAGAVSPEKIDLALIPCVAAGTDGSRLGHGGGYYDAFLHTAGMKKMCLCFAHLLCGQIPMTEADERMDAVVTEDGLIRIRTEEKTLVRL